MFSNHSEIKLKISNRKVPGKSPTIWKVSKIFLVPLLTSSLTHGLFYFDLNENEHHFSKFVE